MANGFWLTALIVLSARFILSAIRNGIDAQGNWLTSISYTNVMTLTA
jgi:hypothetical protein